MRTLGILIALTFACVGTVFADAPTTGSEIPVYPGAVVQSRDEGAATYTVAAWPEEVFAWYQQHLGATRNTADNWEQSVEQETSAGATSPVVYDVRAIDAAEEADLMKTRTVNDVENRLLGTWDGEWVRSVFRDRPRSSEGWLWDGTFQWIHKRSDTQSTWLAVDFGLPELYVEGFGAAWPVMIDGVNKKFTKQVQITIRSEERGGEPEWASKAANLSPAQKAQLEALQAHRPTESDLGVPPYPGAALEFDMMVQNPAMIGHVFPYRTSDAAPKVVAWYEQATGKKAVSSGQGASAILIKGTSFSAAESAVTIQDLAPMGMNQTLIIVLKNMGSR